MTTLNKIKDVIAKVFEWICVVLITLLTILSVVSVVLRYVFGITFIQQEELITFLFVIATFLGTIVVMNQKSHVSVALLQMNMPIPVQKAMEIFKYIVMIAIQVVLLYASQKWIATNQSFLTPGLRILYWTVYIMLPISCFFSMIIQIIDLINTIILPWKNIKEN